MKKRKDTFCGTVDLLTEKSPELCRKTAERRMKQGCAFSVMAAEISSQQEWGEWRKQVNSFWRRDYVTIPGAILTEKSLNPGQILGLPEKFRFLLIPCFSDLPIELPYTDLFSFIRNSGGLVCLISPLKKWESQACGLNGVDLLSCMINGQETLSTALYHLNRRQKIGFIGINQIDNEKNTASFVWLFPGNYKLSEYDFFRSFKNGFYSLSNSNNEFTRMDSSLPASNREHSCSKVSLTLSSKRNKLQAELWKNGRSTCSRQISDKPVSVSFPVKGKEYFFLRTKDEKFCSITAPLFARSPHQLWGDHHVHYINRDSLLDSRMDYIVYGLYGQVHKYEDFTEIIPGGEVHGSTDRGKTDNLHFLVIQKEFKDHSYIWEPGEGNEKTLERAKRYGDFAILAHPPLEGKHLMQKDDLLPDGVEIIYGFALCAPIINRNPRLLSKAKKAFGAELEGLRDDAIKISTDLWDAILSKGGRCLGVGNGDLHGPVFHGAFVNNMGAGYPATVINAENATSEDVQQYLNIGNVWCTDAGFLYLSLQVNGKAMGACSILQKTNKINIEAESSFLITKIIFISQGEKIRTINCNAHNIHETFSIPETKLSKYLRIELTDKGGNTAFSNPVYLKHNKK